MDLAGFINKYDKTKVDYDGYYGPQCVDLVRQYMKDLKGIPHTGGVNGAREMWTRYEELPLEQKYLEKKSLTEGQAGDLIVWDGTKTNPYGHVAILAGFFGDGRVLVFEQDGYKKDGAKFILRSLKNCLGFLRLK